MGSRALVYMQNMVQRGFAFALERSIYYGGIETLAAPRNGNFYCLIKLLNERCSLQSAFNTCFEGKTLLASQSVITCSIVISVKEPEVFS